MLCLSSAQLSQGPFPTSCNSQLGRGLRERPVISRGRRGVSEAAMLPTCAWARFSVVSLLGHVPEHSGRRSLRDQGREQRTHSTHPGIGTASTGNPVRIPVMGVAG